MNNISIIIPTVNSPWLSFILALIKQQIHNKPVEVLVIGLGSFGIKPDKQIKFINTHDKVSPATARNIGIREAKGEILCFLDDDCLPQANWLDNLLKPHKSGKSVVGGSVAFPVHSFWTVCDSLAFFSDFLIGSSSGWRSHLPSLNLSMHRSVIENVGLFDENFPLPAGEDTEFTQRIREAGYGLWFTSTAVIYHAAIRANCLQVWKRAWNFGLSVGVRPSMQNILHPSPIFRHWLIMSLTSIPRASIATLKIFQYHPNLLKYWSYIGGVWLSKLVWQWGATTALYRVETQN